ncbi:hypothetical protein BSI_18230 [Bacillus inaquosorum KCTC 13429]|uniref:Uncharacterized protein n=1 Tax=Bacillus inaquosorum KCTC 13429 TaxID=1236548 RepID=A0A9W5LIP3_9BACI|nr:hypothetical protein BSI_18230 [Bacillus inaquosorum KCTC 13429]
MTYETSPLSEFKKLKSLNAFILELNSLQTLIQQLTLVTHHIK